MKDIPYEGFAWPETHPDRLALLATLHGLEPAHPDRCRVLELGCGDGLNLVAMAAAAEGVEVVGVDIADKELERGRSYARALGLDNVRLETADLSDVGSAYGTFDYVIAHGVYTWVPEGVRGALLRAIRATLEPHGVAYLSFTAMPAGHLRYMVRDVGLLPARYGADDPAARAAAARAILNGLSDWFDGRTDAYAIALKHEADRMLEQSNDTLLHDELNDSYAALWLGEVAEAAARRGLRLLCEADAEEVRDSGATQSIRRGFEHFAGGDPVLTEELVDVVIGRVFHRSLLVHGGAPVVAPQPEAVRGLLAGPERVPIEDPEAAFGAFMRGELDLYVAPARHATVVGERPEAFPLARLQAAEGPKMVSLKHTQLYLDDPYARALIRALDGTRDREQLIEAVTAELGDDALRDAIAEGLDESLATLLQVALLKP